MVNADDNFENEIGYIPSDITETTCHLKLI